jgi:hypothetical protein
MPNQSTHFIVDYFNAERTESYLFIGIGIIAFAFAVFSWWRWGDAIWRGLAIPLIGVALIQIVVGSTVLSRAPRQILELSEQAISAPAQFRSEETARITVVNNNFATYRWIEIAFVIAGLALILFMRERDFWLGMGIGLLLQGSIMLALDQFAERRGATYALEVSKWGTK